MARSGIRGRCVGGVDPRPGQAHLAIMALVVGLEACSVAHPPCAPEGEHCHSAEVAPVAWSSIPVFRPEDDLDQQLIALERNALRYMLQVEVPRYPVTALGLYDFASTTPSPGASLDSIRHDEIRPPAQMVSALAVALSLRGVYDPGGIGVPTAEARRVLDRLISSLAWVHVANADSRGLAARWGDSWQSAHWAFFAGFGAFLVWNTLDASTQEAIARLVVHEARRFDTDPPYADSSRHDTKAEENAWNANILVLAQAMLPSHPEAALWRYRASQWMLGSYTRASDMRLSNVIDGLPLRSWVGGYNMSEQGYVYNHGRVHPDYIASIEMGLWNYLPVALAGQHPPEAMGWNVDVAYRCLQSCDWPSPPYAAPGGTMYRDGEPLVYYPQGTDWSPNRVDNFMIVDVLVDALAPRTLDEATPREGLPWATLRAAHLESMQARSTTGQLFTDDDAYDFVPRESFAAVHFAYALLGRWLARSGRVREPHNWRACQTDADCHAPRACDQSVCEQSAGVCEMRPVAMCESRWGVPEALLVADVAPMMGSPSMTDDGLELYFGAEVAGVSAIWRARRANREDEWGAPHAIPEVTVGTVDGPGSEWDPFVSGDGLTLLFASTRNDSDAEPAETNIWQSTRLGVGRSWDPPTLVAELNSAANERQPQLTRDGRTLVFVSNRTGDDELYMAERADSASPWTLQADPLAPLWRAGRESSPAISDDGLTLYFTSDRGSDSQRLQAYVSERATEGEPFAAPRAVLPLASTDGVADLWVSWDGRELLHMRVETDGTSRLYRSSR